MNMQLVGQGGKTNHRRRPLPLSCFAPPPLDVGEQQEEAVFVQALVEGSIEAGDWLFQAAAEDDNYQLMFYVYGKGTAVNNLPPSHPAHNYRGVWDQLSVRLGSGGLLLLVLDGARIVVPKTERKKVLVLLHLPHAAVEDAVRACKQCIAALPSNLLAEALPPTEATRPVGAVGLDYLIMVDHYSSYPFVHKLASTITSAVGKALSVWWELIGLPAVIREDGGPQFRCQEFKDMCTKKGVELETFSPFNPHLNGLAESAVKNCKKLLLKCIDGGEEFGPALLEFWNCPRADGFSPAQFMFGRRMRTALFAAVEAFASIPSSYATAARKKTHDKALLQIGKRRLESFHEGDEVWVQNHILAAWDSLA